MGQLLVARPGFNYSSDLLQAVVPLMAAADSEMANTACDAIRQLLLEDVQVGLRKSEPRVVSSLLVLRLEQVKPTSQGGQGVGGRQGQHKKANKKKRKKSDLDKDFEEAEAGPDLRELALLQSQMLEALFEIFFRVPTLEGLGRYSHLISVEYFNDLMSVLQEQLLGVKQTDMGRLAAFSKRLGEMMLHAGTAEALGSGCLLWRLLKRYTKLLCQFEWEGGAPVGGRQYDPDCLDPSEAGHYHVWDFNSFDVDFLAPLAATLSPVTHVSVESQVLLYTPAREAARWSKKRGAYVMRQDQLPFFIDSEWAVEAGRAVMQHRHQQQQDSRDSGSISSEPAAAGDEGSVLESHVLHFLVYIPPAEQQPLLLLGPRGKQRDSNSFWMPSWGGLLVLNPSTDGGSDTAGSSPAASSTAAEGAQGGTVDGAATPEVTSSGQWHDLPLPSQSVKLQPPHYKLIAQVAVAQLQALFGVAVGGTQQPGLPAAVTAAATIQVLPAGRLGFSAWQVDAMLRQRVWTDVSEARRVLGSLSQLVQELPNLEMPDVIGQQVQQALHDLSSAYLHIADANYLASGADAAAARAAAEAAFLHPAVLAQLNFPESH
eukprot:gene14170-14311_t